MADDDREERRERVGRQWPRLMMTETVLRRVQAPAIDFEMVDNLALEPLESLRGQAGQPFERPQSGHIIGGFHVRAVAMWEHSYVKMGWATKKYWMQEMSMPLYQLSSCQQGRGAVRPRRRKQDSLRNICQQRNFRTKPGKKALALWIVSCN